MALTLVTEPDYEPLTMEEAKQHLRVDTDDDDALIVDLITAARQFVEGQTKRALVTQTWDLKIDHCWPYYNGQPRIRLPLNPVQSVSSINYVDGSSPNPTLAATQYTVTTRNNGSYIVPAYNVTWPDVRNVPDAVTVRFVAGYTTVPEMLRQAMRLLIAHLYENRENVSMKQGFVIPYGVEAMLSPYRGGRVVS